jgi:calcium-independent phospholipase A2-gamma
MLDSKQQTCPEVFFVSTKVNVNPPIPKIWRNYNYPIGQRSRYPGSFRINTKNAIRATTAAPTFFTPIQWEGGLYCDGAIVANNPTAIALQEAKALYPGIPIELVVSIGTGSFKEKTGAKNMGWDLLVNQIIASATDSEDVHGFLVDFLPSDQYYRFNPMLQESWGIDEKDKDRLEELKQIGRDFVKDMEMNEPDRFNKLMRLLS